MKDLNFARREIIRRGYKFDGRIDGNIFRAIKEYNRGPRYLYFIVGKCCLCSERHLKAKWSKSDTHKSCRLKLYNQDRKQDGE